MKDKEYLDAKNCDVKESSGIIWISRNGIPLECPFAQKNCGSNCPLFTIEVYHSNSVDVLLSCGSSDSLHVNNPEYLQGLIDMEDN